MARAVILALLAACLIGAEVPHVDLSATPTAIGVGETVAVTITYRWPHGWSVAAEPDPSADFRDTFVTAAPPPERLSADGSERRSFRYTIAATRSGAWALPRPRFSASGPNGAVEAQAPAVIIQVGTEAAPPHLPAARPALVRPPADTPAPTRWWWIAGGAALALVAAASWLLGRRQRIDPAATALQVFQSELAAALRCSDAREVGTGISVALRRFAGAHWGFDGPGQTTREITASLRRLAAGAISDEESAALLRLLSRLDDLRWSAGDLPAEVMRELATLAESWAGGVQRRVEAEAAARAAAKGKA
jgi:hypothetical protein